MIRRRTCLHFTASALLGSGLHASGHAQALSTDPPPLPREFRAAWVATVANIDWPSRPGLSTQAQRSEAVAMLDRARDIGLNALILQVRPAADALYASTLEPWSEYLTGTQGKAPEPAYDPLAFWVEQAHARGLELHAWFNPYRARHASAKSVDAPLHVSKRQADVVKRYGDALWMDPGQPQSVAHTLAVVADVVQRYDIDGVHIDDYFYPYPITQGGAELPFPDDVSWQQYVLQGGALGRDAWRRDNVDRLVQALHETVKRLKPWVRVGISPFGLGRPDRRPPGISGFSQYDKLYADVERWLEAGWLDYLAPQLYWRIERREQAFEVLLDYWISQNRQSRHMWPGLFTSRVGAAPQPWPASEVVNQIALARSREASTGQIHFSMIALMKDVDGVATALKRGPYAQPAVVPVNLGAPPSSAPAAPALRWAQGGQGALRVLEIRMEASGSPRSDPFVWAIWCLRGGRWEFSIHTAKPTPVNTVPLDADVSRVVVRAIDRRGQESPPAQVLPT